MKTPSTQQRKEIFNDSFFTRKSINLPAEMVGIATNKNIDQSSSSHDMKTTTTQILSSNQQSSIANHHKNSFMKKFLRNNFVLAISFLIANLFFSEKVGAQTLSQTFATTAQWTCPPGVNSITVQAWGGGGKGGARTTGDNVALAGGGGGAYSSSILSVTPGTVYTVTVGAGSSTTAAGGDSWFGSTATLLAKGGGSVADNSNTRGAGGLASAGVGTTKFNGGTGAAGTTGTGSFGGGGGSSAGTGANGNFTNTTTTQRNGATAPSGGGNGGNGAASGAAGIDGTAPGGGGGGGFRAGSGSTQNPGDGAAGQVVITYSVPAGSCSGYATAVFVDNGVDNQNNAVGPVNGSFAQLYDNGDQLALDLTGGSVLSSGSVLNVTWRRATGTQNNPVITVETSLNGTTWTAVTGSPFTVTVTDPLWITISIPVNTTFRYVRFTDISDFNLDLDAVSYFGPCCTPPTINTQPGNSTISCTANASFTVAATGTGLTYQWQEKVGAAAFTDITDGGVYGGATTSTLSLTNVPLSFNTNQYRVIISSSACSTPSTSNAATLSVTSPTITPAASAATVAFSASPQTTTLSYTATGGATTYSITWNASPANGFRPVTDELLPASPIPIAVPAGTAPGTYTGTISVKNGCTGAGVNFTLTVLSNPAIFTTPSSFTVPPNVTCVQVEAWGGGGKGGTRTSDGVTGGGGGGAYSSSTLAVIAGQNYTVTVGTGSSTTAAGGDSWFSSTGTLLAKGGNSVNDNSSTGATGGSAASGIGQTKFSGGSGSNGNTSGTDFSGGGGSSAGTDANGTAATNQNGAVAPAGGGNGGNGRLGTEGTGTAGSIPGGGGGGALRTGSGTIVGGNGANGQVKITWVDASDFHISAVTPVCGSPGTSTVTITSTSLADGDYAVTYNSTNPNNNGNTGTMSFAGGTGTFQTIALNGPTSNLTITGITFTGWTCSATISSNNTATITVEPAPTVFAGDDKLICSNSPAVQLAGTFGGSASSVHWTSSGDGGFNNANSPTAIYTVSQNDIDNGSVTLTLTTDDPPGVCLPVSDEMTITITKLPIATFDYTSLFHPSTLYCQNEPTGNPKPNLIPAGVAVAGTFTSTAGLVFKAGGVPGEVDLALSTPIPLNAHYTVTNTIAAAGGCPVVTETAPVTILALPTATISYNGIAGGPAAFCTTQAGTVSPTRTPTSGIVSNGYSVDPSGLTINTSTGVITPSTSLPGTYIVTFNFSATCSNFTTTTVTITAPPVATFSYAGSPYCSNGANPSPTFSGGGIAGVFSSDPGLVFVSTSTGQINLAASTAGTYEVKNTIAAAGGCAQVQASAFVTITKLPVATFSYAGSPYCSNASNPTVTLGTGAVAGTFSATPGGLNFVNANTGEINLATTAANTYTITNTIAAANGCGVVTSTAQVTISTAPTVTQPTVSVCEGQQGTLTSSYACPGGSGITSSIGPNFPLTGANVTGVGTLSWSGTGNIGSDNGNSATASVTSGGTQSVTTNFLRGTNFNFPTIPANAQIAGIQVFINRFTNFNTSTVNVKDVTVSLVKALTITGDNKAVTGVNWTTSNATVATYGGNSDLWGTSWTPADINNTGFGVVLSVNINRTSGNDITASVDYISITVTYTTPNNVLNWYDVPANGTAVGSGSSFSPTNTIPGTYHYYVACSLAPSCRTQVDYVIKPKPTVNAISPLTYCDNAQALAINFSTPNPGTPSYHWTNNNTSIGLAASGDGDILPFQAHNATPGPVTATVNVTATIDGCTGAATPFTVTVNPTPTVNMISDVTKCNGEAGLPISFTTPATGGTPTFNWTSDFNVFGFATASGTGNIPAYTATNNTNAPIIATVSVTATINGCTGPARTFTITVKPSPKVDAITDKTYCNGESSGAAITFSTNVAGTAGFKWTSSANVGFGLSGMTNIPIFTAANSGDAPLVSTVNVRATVDGCEGSPTSFTVTVNPTPTVSDPTDLLVCDKASTAAVNFSGAVSGTTFNWTNDNTSIGLAESGTGDIESFTAINNGTTAVIATITVTPAANGCTGEPQSFTITVKPTPTVDDPTDQVVCDNSFTTGVTFTGGVSGTTFNWTNDNTSIGLAASGSGTIAAFKATNTGATPVIATITVTPVADGCPGASQSFTITVNPTPVLTSTLTPAAICSGLFTYQPSSSTPNATFSWTRAAIAGINNNQAGSGNDAIMEGLTNTTGAAIDVIYVYTVSANGCTNPNTFSVKVTVNATTAITVDAKDLLKCIGEPNAKFSVTAGGTSLTYAWHKSNVDGGGVNGALLNSTKYSGVTTNELTISNIAIEDAGNYYVVISGACGNTQSRSAHLMVKEFKISTNPDKTPDSAQYSDPVTFTAKIYNGLSLLYNPAPLPSATFKVAGVPVPGASNVAFVQDVITNDLIAEVTQPLLESGPGYPTASTPPNGPMAPSNTKHNVTAEFNNIPSPLLIGGCGALDTNLVITKENAWIAYTGDVIKATKSATTDTVTLQLRANILDISVPQTPASPLADASPGDIRNARVTFVDREDHGTTAGYLNNCKIIGTANMTPTLVNPLDTKVGSVTSSLLMNVGTAGYSFRTIGIIVDYGYYIRDSEDDDIVLTAYLPSGDFITGGGFIVPTESVGTKASDDYKKTNFGFNVKFNKQGTNLQGNMNIIFRRTATDGLVHNYQIKANAMNSLGVDASNPNRQTAEFVSKVNLRDLNSTTTTTDPDLGGNKYLYVKMVDNGEPGVNDSISFVVVNGTADPTILANVIWSSNWVGSMTKMMNLAGGNLVVHSGFSVGTGPTNRITQNANTEPGVQPFAVQAWPNPSDRQFNLRVTGNLTQKVIIKVYDITGKQLYITSGAANQDYRFGDTFVAGVYIAEVQQGDKRSKIKLVKQ